MPFTTSQIDQLIDAFPFPSRDEWIYQAYQFEYTTGIDASTVFADFLFAAGEALKQAQYLLEEPDSVLLNNPAQVSGQIRPAANAIELLESASDVRKFVVGLILVNTGGAASQCTIYHVKNGGTASDINIIKTPNLLASPNGVVPIDMQLVLNPGESIRVRSVQATVTFSAYIIP